MSNKAKLEKQRLALDTKKQQAPKEKPTLIGKTIIYKDNFSLHHCINALQREEALEESPHRENKTDPKQDGRFEHHIPKIALMHWILADKKTRKPERDMKDLVAVFHKCGYEGISPKAAWKWRDDPKWLLRFEEILHGRMFGPEALAVAGATLIDKMTKGSIPAMKMYYDMNKARKKDASPAEKELQSMVAAVDKLNREDPNSLRKVGKMEVA